MTDERFEMWAGLQQAQGGGGRYDTSINIRNDGEEEEHE